MSGTTKWGQKAIHLVLPSLTPSVKQMVPVQWQLHCIVPYMQVEISLIFSSTISYADKLMIYTTTDTFPLIHNTVYYLQNGKKYLY